MGNDSLLLSDTPTMLVNGKAFEGTVNYEVTDESLRLCTGNPYISCITQFRPIDDFPFARMVYKLLLTLHRQLEGLRSYVFDQDRVLTMSDKVEQCFRAHPLPFLFRIPCSD